MSGGAQFAELAPRSPDNGQLDLAWRGLLGPSNNINQGRIQRVTPLNSFRIGQQAVFWLGVRNLPVISGNYATRLRLKLWWARPNLEYRVPGDPTYEPIDTSTFGGGPFGNEENNRYVWIPSPKRLDTNPFQTAPPPAAVVGTSDSIMLDDVLAIDLLDPTDPVNIANFPPPQAVSVWKVFLYPTMGYSLGVTWEVALLNPQGDPAPPEISLTWTTGALAGSYQESIG